MPTCQAYKCTNKAGIYADSVSWCFAANYTEVFAYDGGKYYFDLSCAMALSLVKAVFFMFWLPFRLTLYLLKVILSTKILKALSSIKQKCTIESEY